MLILEIFGHKFPGIIKYLRFGANLVGTKLISLIKFSSEKGIEC
jgi:hypothetical protein